MNDVDWITTLFSYYLIAGAVLIPISLLIKNDKKVQLMKVFLFLFCFYGVFDASITNAFFLLPIPLSGMYFLALDARMKTKKNIQLFIHEIILVLTHFMLVAFLLFLFAIDTNISQEW